MKATVAQSEDIQEEAKVEEAEIENFGSASSRYRRGVAYRRWGRRLPRPLFFNFCIHLLASRDLHQMEFTTFCYQQSILCQHSPQTTNLCVPRRRGVLMQEHIPPQLAVLIGHRIVQCVGSDISPVSVESNFECSCSSSSHFKDSGGDSKSNICGDHLDTCNPFGNLAACICSESRPIGRVLTVKCSQLVTCTISQSLGGSKVCEEVPVSLEDVELVGRGFFVVTSKGPGTSRGGGVFGGKFQSTNRNAQVKVAED